MEESSLVATGGSLLLGGVLAFLVYYLVGRWLRRNATPTSKNAAAEQRNQQQQQQQKQSEVSGNQEAAAAANKRQAKSKKRREAQQEFSHPWMVGALKGHTAPILDMDFSANGKFLASCAEDRTVLLWCTKDLSSKDRKSLRVNVEYDHATFVRWSPDGKAFIIHKSIANLIEVYKITKKTDGTIASATKASEFPKHHVEDVMAMDIACNGRFIVTSTKDNDIAVWDLKGQILSTVDTCMGSTYRTKISPCGRFVGASGFTPDVKIWEVAFTKTGEFKQVAKGFILGGHKSGVYDFAFNSDSSRMATVSKDGTYRFYNTKIEFEKGEDPRFISSNQWEGSAPSCIALSPNAEIIAISHNSSLSLYSTVNGELDTTITDIFNGPIKCLKFDSLGEYVLVAGDRHIKIFRNIPGYRATIETARQKLSQKQTSATKERLEKTVEETMKLLKDMGERCP